MILLKTLAAVIALLFAATFAFIGLIAGIATVCDRTKDDGSSDDYDA
jgi:hypothetical protein